MAVTSRRDTFPRYYSRQPVLGKRNEIRQDTTRGKWLDRRQSKGPRRDRRQWWKESGGHTFPDAGTIGAKAVSKPRHARAGLCWPCSGETGAGAAPGSRRLGLEVLVVEVVLNTIHSTG